MKSILKTSFKWHRLLFWMALVGLVVYAVSGALHPIMSWTGPKAKAFYPPQMSASMSAVESIPNVLEQNNIKTAILVKAIPGEDQVLIQVTESEDQPRRYFSVDSGEELPSYESQHAAWLASYYAGIPQSEIDKIEFKTEFDSAYPWVNRLLPVYKVIFKGEQQLTTYVYTETNALASITDGTKVFLQSWFRTLHTWHWLNDFEYARVVLISLLILSLMGMAVSGVVLLYLLPKRVIKRKGRRWHRYLGHILWLPLFFYTFSGLYHLLQYSFLDMQRGLRLSAPLSLDIVHFNRSLSMPGSLNDLPLNAVSLVASASGDILYRLSVPAAKPDESVSKQQRFQGRSKEKKAIYINAKSGQVASVNDQQQAKWMAMQYLKADESLLTNSQIITRFGPHYDFRNKRLPVWQFDFNTPEGDKVFIDPATGFLVDRLVDKERYEVYSFSFLHKFNFLTPLTGRQNRDVLIVVLLMLLLTTGIFGVREYLKKKT